MNGSGVRYQVFVSSTYADLMDERRRVIQAIMEMDCIPSGMEIFPALDEEQFDFIKSVIDDCDYYLIIIGGRYGSVTKDGISYTEKEFDYAVSRGVKVIALIHGSPDDIVFGKSEKDPVMRERLIKFREKVTTGRLVRFWTSAQELPALVVTSLSKTIRAYPAVGWVRGGQVATEGLLREINDLRKANEKLSSSQAEIQKQMEPSVSGIASFDAKFEIRLSYYTNFRASHSAPNRISNHDIKCVTNWREIFVLISPYLLEHPTEASIKQRLGSELRKKYVENSSAKGGEIEDQDFKTIGIQMKAYGLVDIRYLPAQDGKSYLFWSITPKGERLMIESRIVK